MGSKVWKKLDVGQKASVNLSKNQEPPAGPKVFLPYDGYKVKALGESFRLFTNVYLASIVWSFYALRKVSLE
jgi:hypothetical protein